MYIQWVPSMRDLLLLEAAVGKLELFSKWEQETEWANPCENPAIWREKEWDAVSHINISLLFLHSSLPLLSPQPQLYTFPLCVFLGLKSIAFFWKLLEVSTCSWGKLRTFIYFVSISLVLLTIWVGGEKKIVDRREDTLTQIKNLLVIMFYRYTLLFILNTHNIFHSSQFNSLDLYPCETGWRRNVWLPGFNS